MSDLPSPNDLVSDLRSAKEDDAARTHIEMKRWLAILEVILPAGLRAAAAGNVTMLNAVHEIAHLLPKRR